jgi:hypothetical protein
MTSSSGVENSRESQSAAAPEATATAYDRAPVGQDVPCPLCYYNLRGVAEPRCPECGYAFEWRDLLDPDRRRHPYLFEHHPRRNAWSLWRTFVGALRPGTFWRELRPAQPSNRWRLLLYWFLTSLPALAVPLGMIATGLVQSAVSTQEIRANYAATGRVTQGWLDLNFPGPGQYEFYRRHFAQYGGRPLERLLTMTAVYAAWPWLTFLALMIFQASMRRAKVKPVHVMRCVTYTFDAIGLFSWALLVAIGMSVAAWLLLGWDNYWRWQQSATAWWMLAAILLLVYRLTIAYQSYLQFRHAFITVFTAQFLVALFVYTALLTVAMWRM